MVSDLPFFRFEPTDQANLPNHLRAQRQSVRRGRRRVEDAALLRNFKLTAKNACIYPVASIDGIDGLASPRRSETRRYSTARATNVTGSEVGQASTGRSGRLLPATRSSLLPVRLCRVRISHGRPDSKAARTHPRWTRSSVSDRSSSICARIVTIACSCCSIMVDRKSLLPFMPHFSTRSCSTISSWSDSNSGSKAAARGVGKGGAESRTARARERTLFMVLKR
jgi:hypothetical protein